MISSLPAQLIDAVRKIPAGGNVYIYARVSKQSQVEGDGIERQLDDCHRLAAMLGLKKPIVIKDEGQSGYFESNIRDGNLGRFIEDLPSIPLNSILIVENMDRLTRSDPTKALSLLLRLIEGKVTTICYRGFKVLNADALNGDVSGYILSIVEMHRANSESAVKQARANHVWDGKRRKVAEAFAGGKKLRYSRRCPEWLEWSDEAGWFIERPDRVLIVRRIFDNLTNGMGRDLIARHLNSENVPPWGSGRENRWHGGCVQKITDNRSVLGEFQMHTHEMNPKYPGNRKLALRVPVGDPIQNYFPSVIPPELWRAVRAVSEKRAPVRVANAGGQQGINCTNLFTRMAKCGVCGGSMYIRDRRRRSEPRFQCRNSTDGHCDHRTMFSVDAVEKGILRWAADYTPSILRSDDINPLERQLAELQENHAQKIKRRELILDNFGTGDDDSSLKKKIHLLKSEIDDLANKIRKKQYELDKARGEESAHQSLIHEMPSKIENAASASERFAIRSAVRESLKEVIETVRFFPEGFAILTVGRVLIVQFDLSGCLDLIVIPEYGYWGLSDDFDADAVDIWANAPPDIRAKEEESVRRYKAVQNRFSATLEKYRADGVKLSFQLRGDAIRQILKTVPRAKPPSSQGS